MIELKNLVKRYGNHLAVDGLNVTLEDGKIYGFLGPNGAGKSTTMNMITGYLAPTEGEIFVNGHSILDEPEEVRKSIGYLPEIPPLYTDMTVREYLLFCADLKKIPKGERQEQLNRVLELVRLNEVSHRLIRNLSKGYRQRVGLAQAILGFPPILILDEPTVGLDPKQIIEIRDLIRELGKEHTVILSSHILSEVQEVCDQILIISHGKLVANDTVEGLEHHLKGETSLSLTLRGSEHAVTQLAREQELEVLDTRTSGDTMRLLVSMKEDKREELFYACAEAKLPILEMTVQTASLEAVFLELTGESATKKEEN